MKAQVSYKIVRSLAESDLNELHVLMIGLTHVQLFRGQVVLQTHDMLVMEFHLRLSDNIVPMSTCLSRDVSLSDLISKVLVSLIWYRPPSFLLLMTQIH